MNRRINAIAGRTFAPESARNALESLLECSSSVMPAFERASDEFLAALSRLLIVSPAMLDCLRSHPEWIGWLHDLLLDCQGKGRAGTIDYEAGWRAWYAGKRHDDEMESLRVFKRRESMGVAFCDIAGLIDFEETVGRLSGLADCVIRVALRHCSRTLLPEGSQGEKGSRLADRFAVFGLGKLGGRELNYSSDVDLLFCRSDSESEVEVGHLTRLGEKLVETLAKVGHEGFLYRVDMRLRPHGETGPLVPTLNGMINYYESWGEPWERQALIKARFIAGAEEIGRRLHEFIASYTFARQMDDSALEEIKRVKHRSEKEYGREPAKVNVKQGPGGIRDIEFYVQYLQLIGGWRWPDIRSPSTLKAIEGLGRAKLLLEGEESQLSLAYRFLRTVEHRLQLRSLTPEAMLPQTEQEAAALARGLGFQDSGRTAVQKFLAALQSYRGQVRTVLERVYLSPGYLSLTERQEEFAQLLSERAPRERVYELLSQYGFTDIEKAWQNVRLLALGPAGRILPPGERRTFLEFAFPLLEALKGSIDPDRALHHLESFAAATGNRVSFLRTLAARRPHLIRLTNLLAYSNLCQQVLSRHPEYFDSLARGLFLHEGRSCADMLDDLRERLGASPRGEAREIVLRRFRQKEMVRVAYRDMSGLASAVEVSRELSDLAEACVLAALDWTRTAPGDPLNAAIPARLHAVGMGKLGSRQMHFSSDLDLLFLYDSPPAGAGPDERARIQQQKDDQTASMLEILSAVSSEGVTYPVDLRLRPEGSAGLLARSTESFLAYAGRFMQPWERMSLVRSRHLGGSAEDRGQWTALVTRIVYQYPWDDEALDSIRHLKRRIESEKNKESRIYLDFKYGRGGIADLEFLVQFLQIRFGSNYSSVRVPALNEAVQAMRAAGFLSAAEEKTILEAHQFQRLVENRYQLIEEWNSREISRESPVLARLARSLGFGGNSDSAVRKAFLEAWEVHAGGVRSAVDRLFYA